jgi:ubiquinone/menaquinone biosynthesis C-methylase UbiE
MNDSHAPTDHDVITQHAYATDEHLAVRIRTHEQFTRPEIDFPAWVLDKIPWRGNEQVLDVGAGSGNYFELVQARAPHGKIIAGDLSFGMATQAKRHPLGAHIPVLELDAQHLPFATNSFDVVLANHMLYHVPSIQQALNEIERVLRPGGCLIAATNSEDTLEEFDTLARRACTLLGYPRQHFRQAHANFSLENGTMMMARHFRAVARYDVPSTLHFPTAEPVLEFLNSIRPLGVFQLPKDVVWDDFIQVIDKQVRRLIRRDGELRVRKLAGALVGTNGGGFAEDYFARLDGRDVG